MYHHSLHDVKDSRTKWEMKNSYPPEIILKSDLLPGSCVFCDSEDNLLSMHKDYFHNGKSENYTNILYVCFNIKVVGLNVGDECSEVCKMCVARLRDAFLFRKQIQAVDETFHGDIVLEQDKKIEMTIKTQHKPIKSKSMQRLPSIKNEKTDESDSDQDIYDDLSVENDCSIDTANMTHIEGDNNQKEIKQASVEVPPLDPSSTVCPVCKEQFHLHPVLVQHYPIHFPNFLCDICSRACLDKDSLRRHMKSHLHTKKLCNICNRTYSNRSALQQHLITVHKGVKTFCCKLCPERFRCYETRSKHLVKVHGQQCRMYPCVYCDKLFYCQTKLTEHTKRGHLNQKDCLCDICGRACFNKASLKKHMKSHSHTKHPCNVCNRTYTNRSALLQHCNRVHKGVKTYCCTLCSERFRCYETRSKHLVKVHDQQCRMYPCLYCDKIFYRPSKLAEHTKRGHLNQKNFLCVKCNKEFYSKGELTDHSVIHTGEKAFHCEKCGKSYARKKTLTEHLKIHANLRAHKCSLCDKAFVQKCTLKGHMKTHIKKD